MTLRIELLTKNNKTQEIFEIPFKLRKNGDFVSSIHTILRRAMIRLLVRETKIDHIKISKVKEEKEHVYT